MQKKIKKISQPISQYYELLTNKPSRPKSIGQLLRQEVVSSSATIKKTKKLLPIKPRIMISQQQHNDNENDLSKSHQSKYEKDISEIKQMKKLNKMANFQKSKSFRPQNQLFMSTLTQAGVFKSQKKRNYNKQEQYDLYNKKSSNLNQFEANKKLLAKPRQSKVDRFLKLGIPTPILKKSFCIAHQLQNAQTNLFPSGPKIDQSIKLDKHTQNQENIKRNIRSFSSSHQMFQNFHLDKENEVSSTPYNTTLSLRRKCSSSTNFLSVFQDSLKPMSDLRRHRSSTSPSMLKQQSFRLPSSRRSINSMSSSGQVDQNIYYTTQQEKLQGSNDEYLYQTPPRPSTASFSSQNKNLIERSFRKSKFYEMSSSQNIIQPKGRMHYKKNQIHKQFMSNTYYPLRKDEIFKKEKFILLLKKARVNGNFI